MPTIARNSRQFYFVGKNHKERSYAKRKAKPNKIMQELLVIMFKLSRKFKTRRAIALISISLIGLLPYSCYASMKLYISDDCDNCKLVMEGGRESIEALEVKGDLEVINITGIKTDLPAVPALVDGQKVVIGTGLVENLREKADLK